MQLGGNMMMGMVNPAWARWLLQTAQCWEDIEDLMRNTGVESLDQEHKRIIESTLEMNQAIESFDQQKGELIQIELQVELFQTFYEDTKSHFAQEEKIAQEHKLTGYDACREYRQEFLEKLLLYSQEIKVGRLTISQELQLSLLEWWLGHLHVDYDIFFVELSMSGFGS